MQLSIIIPAYNEAQYLGAKLDEYLAAFSPDTEFLIVPNGCTDKTPEIAQTYAQRFPNVQVHVIPEAVGKAMAVRAGWKLAKGEWVAFLDADGSTSALEFQHIFNARRDADGVIASRWAPGARVENRSGLRKLASYVFAAVVKILFWMPYRDTQCGAKIFQRSLIQRILPFIRVRNIAFDVELLLLCRRAGANIVEYPTHWIDRSDSVIIGSPLKLVRSSLVMLWTLFSLRIRFLPFIAPRP
jgi:glycosyltransferase involved in cell wall biosynthesis